MPKSLSQTTREGERKLLEMTDREIETSGYEYIDEDAGRCIKCYGYMTRTTWRNPATGIFTTVVSRQCDH